MRQNLRVAGLMGVFSCFAQAGEPLPAGTTYSVFTGVTDPTTPPNPPESRFLIEPVAPPVRDDIVTFDGTEELLNDYSAVAGGIQRLVTESLTAQSENSWRMTVVVRGVAGGGGPGDLWPRGLINDQGVAATAGVFGVGLEMPAILGGQDLVDWSTTYLIQSARLRVSSNGTYGVPLDLTGFIQPNPANWSGRFGVVLVNQANNDAVQDAIEFTVDFVQVPEPSSICLFGVAGLAAALRRR